MEKQLLETELALAEARLAARDYDPTLTPSDLEWVHQHFRRNLRAAEFAHLTRFVPRDRAALDLGANCGHYSLMLASLCPEVISVEPLPDCARVSEALPAWCRWHQLALGNTNDRAILTIPNFGGNPCGGMATFTDVTQYGHTVHEQIEVERRRLDDLLAEHPPRHRIGFMKVDVEGFEIPLFEGARETFARHRPNVFVELWDQAQLDAGVKFFTSIDYVGLFFFDGVCHSVGRFDPEIHWAPENAWGVADPFNPELSVNTFYFVPR